MSIERSRVEWEVFGVRSRASKAQTRLQHAAIASDIRCAPGTCKQILMGSVFTIKTSVRNLREMSIVERVGIPH